MPDLRWTALVAALQLLILFPLLFPQAHRPFHLFRVEGPAGFPDWFWFAIDKAYLKALPDWSILYVAHISAIDFDAPWGRHLVILSRLTVDYILIQRVLRLLAIRATVGEAVAAVKAHPEMAVRLGRRATGPLRGKLHDPDKAVRGAAANALTQLGDQHAIRRISEAVAGQPPARASLPAGAQPGRGRRGQVDGIRQAAPQLLQFPGGTASATPPTAQRPTRAGGCCRGCPRRPRGRRG
jgi:hypothetical protein